MNGNRSHLLCRPVFNHDAKEKQSRAQGLQARFISIESFAVNLLDTGTVPSEIALLDKISLKLP
jgi:hypothetical protein